MSVQSTDIPAGSVLKGDHIHLRADMDVWVAISNCPQDKNAANGFNPTSLKVVVYQPQP
jgi:uncharacterized protein YcgI (DUF1989 family)